MTALDERTGLGALLLAHTGAAYDIGDAVVPVSGPFLGYLGEVDELDLADEHKPFRVRFDLEGDPVAWYGAPDLMPGTAPALPDAPLTEHRMEFTRPTTVTPQQARRWAARILTEQDVAAVLVDRATVVTCELVTNAALHGPMDGVIAVTVRRLAAGIEIAVHDQGSLPAAQWAQPGGADEERGRGLTIVRGLSQLLDVEVHRFGGKTVTAVIA